MKRNQNGSALRKNSVKKQAKWQPFLRLLHVFDNKINVQQWKKFLNYRGLAQ
jgi:hypothetical protein